MKNKIIHKSAELFLEYGFKSVTMDYISSELGVSKKTIYEYFNNKSHLIEEVSRFISTEIQLEIDNIMKAELNPIEELFEIKRCVLKRLKDEKASPQFQMQKYYPEIYQRLRNSQVCKMDECCSINLKRGITLGYYRENINEVFITRLYISGMLNLKNEELFKDTDLTPKQLYEEFLIYHLRSIATTKGLEILKQTEITK
jgi:AcrR family transcriptional regulator